MKIERTQIYFFSDAFAFVAFLGYSLIKAIAHYLGKFNPVTIYNTDVKPWPRSRHWKSF